MAPPPSVSQDPLMVCACMHSPSPSVSRAPPHGLRMHAWLLPPAPLQSQTPRSVEDLKERYYSIARRLLAAREGGEPAVANHTLMRYPYNR